jgi:hypothetical protein
VGKGKAHKFLAGKKRTLDEMTGGWVTIDELKRRKMEEQIQQLSQNLATVNYQN